MREDYDTCEFCFFYVTALFMQPFSSSGVPKNMIIYIYFGFRGIFITRTNLIAKVEYPEKGQFS